MRSPRRQLETQPFFEDAFHPPLSTLLIAKHCRESSVFAGFSRCRLWQIAFGDHEKSTASKATHQTVISENKHKARLKESKINSIIDAWGSSTCLASTVSLAKHWR